MKSFLVKAPKKFSGTAEIPGDKSVSHRAVMISSISEGEVKISNFLRSEDCMRTVKCFADMGLDIEETSNGLMVRGRGLFGLRSPSDILYAGNSGTTIRLILGILAGQPFEAIITGDESIKRRPMRRVAEPLKLMGAKIEGSHGGEFAPLTIRGGELKPIDYEPPVPSAQVKSAILLAALFAEGTTHVTEKVPTRDHTERMLEHFGAKIGTSGGRISVTGRGKLKASSVYVPSDTSSAAYVIAAALLLPGSDVLLKDIGVNPGRTGILDVLHRMGAQLEVSNERMISGEPIADIRVRHSKLKGVEIGGSIIPRVIDELPVIALIATQAEGDTKISDAAELRVKESDRIAAAASEFAKLGAHITEMPDGMIIKGGTPLKGGACESRGDHRIAMSCAVGGLISSSETAIQDVDCVETSFPGFSGLMNEISGSRAVVLKEE